MNSRNDAPGDQPATSPYEPTQYGHWAAHGLEARLVSRLAGVFKKKPNLFVELQASGSMAHFMLAEVRDLTAGRLAIVEGVPREPTAFLCLVSAAAADSTAGEMLTGLPADAVAFLPVEQSTSPAAVLTAEDFASFGRWIETLPQKL